MLHASGGLVYHTRAYLAARAGDRWAQARAQATARALAWLERSAPEHLVLFGPSAGYLLAPEALEKTLTKLTQAARPLRRLSIAEPDRVARWIFRHRFRRALATVNDVQWLGDNTLLPFFNNDDRFQRYCENLAKQRTAILFWGLLGQIELHRAEFRRDRGPAQTALLRGLSQVSAWASLHDALSFQPGSGEALDHETAWLEAGQTNPATIEWPLTTDRVHQLHMVTFPSAPPV